MNPKYRREKNLIRWWFAATDIDGSNPQPGTILYSPSSVRFLVVERYKVPPSVPEVPGEVEAISAEFQLVGPHKPSGWSRVYTDPSIAAREIVKTMLNLYGASQEALFSLDGARLTDKGSALRRIRSAEQSGNIADALQAAQETLKAFGFQVPDPPPSSDQTQPTAQTRPDSGPSQQTSGMAIDWWAAAKVAAVVAAVAYVATQTGGDD